MQNVQDAVNNAGFAGQFGMTDIFIIILFISATAIGWSTGIRGQTKGLLSIAVAFFAIPMVEEPISGFLLNSPLVTRLMAAVPKMAVAWAERMFLRAATFSIVFILSQKAIALILYAADGKAAALADKLLGAMLMICLTIAAMFLFIAFMQIPTLTDLEVMLGVSPLYQILKSLNPLIRFLNEGIF